MSLPGRAAKLPAAEPAAVNAPLFRRLVDSLSAEKRSVVLDLGPVRSETVALLTPFRCRLDIADLAEGLQALDQEPDPALLRERAEALLPPPRPEPVDIVLCWDLLNYLQRPAIAALMTCISARMRPGGFAHLLIVYSGTTMPARPSRFAPLPDGRLIETATTDARRSAPRYSPEDLGKCMRGLRSESATLLRNGMQEFLFRA
ncbi:MAG: class I SAM-dependent methyltransferase [Chromatiales bacterium]|nr:class I SAM-dependent methyltransferase [Chromatiales bacterium]